MEMGTPCEFGKGLRPSGQELEPDLKTAQELILWADHLVFVTPVWWGSVPALLKGFIDRTFLPGFAFKYHSNDPWWSLQEIWIQRTQQM